MTSVPTDFPRCGVASVGGAQPKLVGRIVQGRFVEGWTDEELLTRYEGCRDLAEQLVEYARRKRVQMAELPLREFLRRMRAGVLKKRWDVDPDELTWVMRRVAEAMGGGSADVPGEEVVLTVSAAEPAQQTYIPSVVDLALGRVGPRRPCKTPSGDGL